MFKRIIKWLAANLIISLSALLFLARWDIIYSGLIGM